MGPATDDRTEIADVLARYAWALIDQDWVSYESCFTPDAALDFSSTGGPAGTPAEAAAWMATTMAAFAVTFNVIGNVHVRVDDDAATSRTAFSMLLKTAGESPTYLDVRGWYDDEHVRTADGWRIARRTESLVDMRPL